MACEYFKLYLLQSLSVGCANTSLLEEKNKLRIRLVEFKIASRPPTEHRSIDSKPF